MNSAMDGLRLFGGVVFLSVAITLMAMVGVLLSPLIVLWVIGAAVVERVNGHG